MPTPTIRADVPPIPLGMVQRHKTVDFLTLDGCRELCAMIEAAWAAVGHPEVKSVPMQHHERGVPPYYAPHTIGLIGGAPIAPPPAKGKLG